MMQIRLKLGGILIVVGVLTTLVVVVVGQSASSAPAVNIAKNAKVLVSSIEPHDYRQEGLTDGVIGGYPDNKSAEWSSDQRVGASCTLTWDTPQKVNRIRLYDRVNPTDQVTSGILTFSDNSSLTVGALPEDRTPLEIKFSTKTITSVTFKVTGVKDKSEFAGLAEIEVFQAN